MKYIIDVHGELEGDYDIIGKYEERPEGKWLIIWHKSLSGTWNNYYEYRCSECGHFSQESEYLRYSRPHFCPMCGAKMVDEVQLEDKVSW